MGGTRPTVFHRFAVPMTVLGPEVLGHDRQRRSDYS